MPDVDIDTGLRLYPGNNGPNGTALARDEEIFVRRIVQGANFVQTGGVYGNPSGRNITFTAMRAYIDGRQVVDTSDGSFAFEAPASSTIYVMLDRTGRLFYRTTNNPTADSEMVIHEIITDGSSVTSHTDLRRLNQFTEVGVNTDEKIYLKTDRTVYLTYQSSDGRVRLPGIFQPNGIRGLPTPTQDDEAANKEYVDDQIAAFSPPDASTTVKGITKMSVAPASPTSPIAVGDNDARVTADQAAGVASIRTIGTGALQAMAGNTRLDQVSAPTASVSLNSQKITSLGTPTAASDAATKGYVDAAIEGLDVKASVKCATTANITLSGEQTIDGFTTSASRVLVKNQSDQTQNGIYVSGAGAWTRASDADTGAEVTAGMFVFVEEGTTNADSGWVLVSDGTLTLGSSNLAFIQFSGAGQITAGSGLSKTGNTLDVNVDNSTLEISSDSLRVKALGIADAHVAAANKDGADATASMRTLGYTAGKAMPGAARLDQIAVPTAAVSMNSQKITSLAAPSDASDAARFDTVTSRVKSYADVDASDEPNSFEILSQGVIVPVPLDTIGAAVPGYASHGIQTNSTLPIPFSILPAIGPATTTGVPVAGFPRGVRLFAKGFYKAISDSPLSSTHERFGLIVMFNTESPSAAVARTAIDETESARDNVAAVGVIVDDSENIKVWSNAAGGDAGYTDTGFDADLSAGTEFEVIVEMEEDAAPNQIGVQIKMRDGGGTMRSVFGLTAPASGTSVQFASILLVMNQLGYAARLHYKIEKT